MNIDGLPYRTIWLAADGRRVEIIDQTRLPHEFRVVTLATLEDTAGAIRDMLVRGAPLIGATAAYGVCLGAAAGTGDRDLERHLHDPCRLPADRGQPALGGGRMRAVLLPPLPGSLRGAAYQEAGSHLR